MLSRVANHLYWMARFIERAGNLARMVDANAQMLIDIASDLENDSLEFWFPLLEASALTGSYHEWAASHPDGEVAEFLTVSRTNPDSITSNIEHARENARAVRDQISEELWLELNTLHLVLKDIDREERKRNMMELCQRIVRFSLLFEGIAHATLPHNEGWQFIRCGLILERADKTSRILDIPHRLPGLGRAALPWGAVLRSCSAGPAYRECYGGSVSEWKVINLLIFSDTFPRSIRFCLRQLDDAMRAISGTPPGQHSNEGERITGGALADLDYAAPDHITGIGLRDYLDRLQTQINEIGQHLFETYVLLPLDLEALNLEPNRLRAYQQQINQQQQ